MTPPTPRRGQELLGRRAEHRERSRLTPSALAPAVLRDLLFSKALGLFTAALGTTVSLADLVVIIITVSLVAGLLPVPGAIGVVESGLSFSLEVEVDGVWPWSRWRLDGPGNPNRPPPDGGAT